MEFTHYFNPIAPAILQYHFIPPKEMKQRMAAMDIHLPEKPIAALSDYDIAIVGVPEDRNTTNKGTAQAPDEIRKFLYPLLKPAPKMKIADLGNLHNGKTVNDTYYALRDIVMELVKNNVATIVLGGGQDLTYPLYMAYEKLELAPNIAAIDPRLDIGDAREGFDANSYISKILLNEDNALLNYTNLGYQTYYTSPTEIELLEKLHFDAYRLGVARQNIEETEPAIRDADIVSFDINAIKQADAPAHIKAVPHGFHGEEACQLARYAGISDKVSAFGLFETNPKYDRSQQTAHLAATIVWHFIQGFYQRKKDYPFSDIKHCVKNIVAVNDGSNELVFYQSRKSKRWWMEVPYQRNGYQKRMIIACSYYDYQTACKNEIPDRWWQAIQRIG